MPKVTPPRRQLESELAATDRELASLESRHAAVVQQLSNSDSSHDSSLAKLEELKSSIVAQLGSLTSDQDSAEAIHKLIVDVYNKVGKCSEGPMSNLSVATARAASNHLDQVRTALNACQDMVDFLSNRVQFCQDKVVKNQQERAQMVSLGLADAASTHGEIDSQMKKMISQDNSTLNRVRSLARSACANASASLTSDGASAADPTPILAKLESMLAELRSRGCALDLSRLDAAVVSLGKSVARVKAQAHVNVQHDQNSLFAAQPEAKAQPQVNGSSNGNGNASTAAAAQQQQQAHPVKQAAPAPQQQQQQPKQQQQQQQQPQKPAAKPVAGSWASLAQK